MNGNKKWWQSKTLWFNIAMAAATTAEASFGLLQPVLPGNEYASLAFVLAIGNAMLRIISTQGIEK